MNQPTLPSRSSQTSTYSAQNLPKISPNIGLKMNELNRMSPTSLLHKSPLHPIDSDPSNLNYNIKSKAASPSNYGT